MSETSLKVTTEGKPAYTPSPIDILTNKKPWYNPSGWPLRTKTLVGGGSASLIVVGVILGAVIPTIKKEKAANAYPDYAPLQYALVDAYAGAGFFEEFRYFTEEDPTKGFVKYVDRASAQNLNLTFASNTAAILKVDTSTRNASTGRQSVRIASKKSYEKGLFLFDVAHAPYGCGTWPALWMTDEYNWPKNGEIDIMEASNNATEGNHVTLHTNGGCSMNVQRRQTGRSGNANCDSTHSNIGCEVTGEPGTYGEEFNKNGGGVYAVELRNAGIRVWSFPRQYLPLDISNSSSHPDPSQWPMPLADFPNTDCDIPSHFRNQSIIVNIDLCGELGALMENYRDLNHCPATCERFVATNPESFTEAYWEFKSFKVFQAL